ncbi:hypothetical protein ACFX12_043339 [Malus domestica]
MARAAFTLHHDLLLPLISALEKTEWHVQLLISSFYTLDSARKCRTVQVEANVWIRRLQQRRQGRLVARRTC